MYSTLAMPIFDKRVVTDRARPGARRRSFERLEDRLLLAGDVVMYNDHIAGPATHALATAFATIGVSSGLLLDSDTGDITSILLSTQSAIRIVMGRSICCNRSRSECRLAVPIGTPVQC